MSFFLLALAVQTADTPDNVVAVTPQGDHAFQLALTTTEKADVTAAKMKAAAEEACRETGIAFQSGVILEMLREKPLRARLSQSVTCKPAPKS